MHGDRADCRPLETLIRLLLLARNERDDKATMLVTSVTNLERLPVTLFG